MITLLTDHDAFIGKQTPKFFLCSFFPAFFFLFFFFFLWSSLSKRAFIFVSNAKTGPGYRAPLGNLFYVDLFILAKNPTKSRSALGVQTTDLEGSQDWNFGCHGALKFKNLGLLMTVEDLRTWEPATKIAMSSWNQRFAGSMNVSRFRWIFPMDPETRKSTDSSTATECFLIIKNRLSEFMLRHPLEFLLLLSFERTAHPSWKKSSTGLLLLRRNSRDSCFFIY